MACGALVAAPFPGDAHLSRRRSAPRVRVPVSAAMADAEPEAEDGSEGGGGGGGRAPPGQIGSAARVAPLGPEQLRRVLEQVTKAQPPAEPPPPFVLQDAARRLRDAAQQAALQRGPSAGPPRPQRLLPPKVRRREGRGETEAPREPRPRGGRPEPHPRFSFSALELPGGRGQDPPALKLRASPHSAP